jgi:hypothetical protein
MLGLRHAILTPWCRIFRATRAIICPPASGAQGCKKCLKRVAFTLLIQIRTCHRPLSSYMSDRAWIPQLWHPRANGCFVSRSRRYVLRTRSKPSSPLTRRRLSPLISTSASHFHTSTDGDVLVFLRGWTVKLENEIDSRQPSAGIFDAGPAAP